MSHGSPTRTSRLARTIGGLGAAGLIVAAPLPPTTIETIEQPSTTRHASTSNTGVAIHIVMSNAPERQRPHQGSAPALTSRGSSTESPGSQGPFGWKVERRKKEVASAAVANVVGEGLELAPVGAESAGYPYRAVVSIVTNGSDCSGWLFGPDIVMTAGHCVHAGGRWATIREVVPARFSGGEAPFGTCKATALYSTVGWTVHQDEAFDYGAIKLDCRIGDQTGWFGYEWSHDDRRQVPVAAIGYVGRRTHRSPGRIEHALGGQLFYDNDTRPEMSGGVLHAPGVCEGCAIAVHSTGCHEPSGTPPTPARCSGTGAAHVGFNHGTAISREVFQNMQAWRSAPAR